VPIVRCRAWRFAASDPEDNFYQGYANGVKLYAPYKDTLAQIGDPQSMSYTPKTAAPAQTTVYSEDRHPGLWIYHDLSQVKGMVIYRDVDELTKNHDAFGKPGYRIQPDPYHARLRPTIGLSMPGDAFSRQSKWCS